MYTNDLMYMAVELPEDIQRLKWYGDFERADRVIALRLKRNLPTALRKRLEFERELLKRLPILYPYTKEAAISRMKEYLHDVTDTELEDFRDSGEAEFLYVNGEVRYKEDFLENLIKTRPDIVARLKNPEMVSLDQKKKLLLNETIKKMKKSGGLAYRIRIKASLKVNEESETPGKKIRVHLPLPVEYAQVRNFKLLSCSAEDYFVAPPQTPQRTVCIETEYKLGQEFYVEYEFENHMKYNALNPDEVLEEQPDFYLEEQLPHIRFLPYLKELTQEVVGEETNPLLKAKKIYEYITSNIIYCFQRPYFTHPNLAEHMATGLRGDCGLYALLFITMCRIAGVPARWQAGLYATPYGAGVHDWAQFYVAPWGWLYADCSFGGAAHREGAKERWDFYFGNLEPFRVPSCSEFQQEFIPRKKYLRDDPYDNQVGEAEYEDRGLLNRADYQTKREILAFEEIPYQSVSD